METITKIEFRRQVFKDFVQMSVLYLLSIYFVYFSSRALSNLFFLIPLVLFWHSKKDYFWFGYFFILVSGTAYLLINMNLAAVHRLPIYNLRVGTSFSIIDIFVIVAFIKAVFKGNKRKLITKNPLVLFLLYFILITIPVSIILGSDKFFAQLRGFSYYSLVLSYFWLVSDDVEILKFGYLLVPYVILNIFDQLHFLFLNKPVLAMIDPSQFSFFAGLRGDQFSNEVRPVMGGVLLVFYSMIFGFQLFRNHKYEIFPKVYIGLISLSIFSFLLSVTRVWYFTILVVLTTFIYFYDKDKMRAINKFILLATVIIVSTSLIALFNIGFVTYIQLRYFSAIQAIFNGQIFQFDSAAIRINDNLPQVMSGFLKSPILGVGFSNYFMESYNSNLGFVNTLMIYGSFGFLIFLYMFIHLFKYLNYALRKRVNNLAQKNFLISMKVCLVGILFAYAFTWDFFNPISSFVIFFTCIFIATVNTGLYNILRQIPS